MTRRPTTRRARTPRGIGARVGDRLAAALLSVLGRLLRRLPDAGLHRAAEVAGAGLYLARPARRSLVRRNLARVCAYLAAEGIASEEVARAASDPRALDRLVRDAFGHYVRAYLEVVLAPGLSASYVAERIVVETPEVVADAFSCPTDERGRREGTIFIALHLGSLELPGLYAVVHGGTPVTAPMETIDAPALQAYLERSRGANGVRLIPARGSARPLSDALDRGESVALVADRAVTSGGRAVRLFGARARLPIGPALLALASGAPTYVAAVRRSGYGRYAARLIRLSTPSSGTQRERVTAFLAAQARAFETLVADAPEQWWTLFFPLWDDDEEPRERERRREERTPEEQQGSTASADGRPVEVASA